MINKEVPMRFLEEVPIHKISDSGAPVRLKFKIARQAKAVWELIPKYKDYSLENLREAFWDKNITKPQAFSIIYWVYIKQLGIYLHTEQLLAALYITEGSLVELATGEGKTFVGGVVLAYWARINPAKTGVHAATANEYLAARDAQTLLPVYEGLGLTAAARIKTTPLEDEYSHNIVYATAQQLGFDFLTDRLAKDRSALRHKGFFAALVDEADALLIDEARNSLILAGPSGANSHDWNLGAAWSRNLREGAHYLVDYERNEAVLTAEGVTSAELFFNIDNLYDNPTIANLAFICMKAKALYKLNKDYIVSNNEIVLIDQATGRPVADRRVQDGIHEALEALERISNRDPSFVYNSITLPMFFQRYTHFGGMSGTLITDASELTQVYGNTVVHIPTHNKLIRKDNKDILFSSKENLNKTLVSILKEAKSKGQPVLIGTVSVQDSENLSAYLAAAGVEHTLLNAKSLESEADIIARAGNPGTITVSTDIAGRGVDIKLGGQFGKYYNEVVEAGGLKVIGVGRHEERRVDDQLRGRSGRQGEVGETQFLVSLDDEVLKNFGGERITKVLEQVGDLITGASGPSIDSFVSKCQSRVSGYFREARDSLWDYDRVINSQRESYWALRDRILENNLPENISLWYAILAEISVKLEPRAYETMWPHADVALTLANFKDRVKDHWGDFSEDVMNKALTHILLQSTDLAWATHIRDLEALKVSVTLRNYAGIDPLSSFSLDASELWESSLRASFVEATGVIWKYNLEIIPEQQPESEFA